MPIILQSSSIIEDYEGDFDARRNIQFDFTFVAKSYVFGPVKTSKIIRETDITFWDSEKFTSLGGPTGASGALSMLETTITGPSGVSSGIDDFTSETRTFVHGISLDSAGNTYA